MSKKRRKDYPNWPNQILPSLSREEVIKLIDSVLNRQKTPERKMFGLIPPHTTGPEIIGAKDLENPQQELAAYDAVRQYPRAASGVTSIHTGKYLGDDTVGVHIPNVFRGSRIRLSGGFDSPGRTRDDGRYLWPISYRDSFDESMDTIRHELSHAQGLRDEGPSPTAYDIGYLSKLLHRDIILPPGNPYEKSKLNMGPTNQVIKNKLK